MLLAVCHSDRGWSRIEDLGTLSDLRGETGNLLWVETDAVDLTEEDIAVLAEEFDLDPLAVEDATAPRPECSLGTLERSGPVASPAWSHRWIAPRRQGWRQGRERCY